MPADAVEVADDMYAALLAGQSEGRVISVDEDGKPVLTAPPGPTPEQVIARERALRDSLLAASDWVVARHRDEVDAELPTTLTSEQFKGLLAYRQLLRDLPANEEFPDLPMPDAPEFLASIV